MQSCSNVLHNHNKCRSATEFICPMIQCSSKNLHRSSFSNDLNILNLICRSVMKSAVYAKTITDIKHQKWNVLEKTALQYCFRDYIYICLEKLGFNWVDAWHDIADKKCVGNWTEPSGLFPCLWDLLFDHVLFSTIRVLLLNEGHCRKLMLRIIQIRYSLHWSWTLHEQHVFICLYMWQ